MRRFTLLILSALLFGSAIAQITREFRNTPLTDALRTIEQGQKEYTISILADGLANLRTSAKVKNLSAPDAVRLVCKGLPVKVKVRGQRIYVQHKHQEKNGKKTEVSVWGYLVDDMMQQPVAGAKVTIMSAKDSTIIDSIVTRIGNRANTPCAFVRFDITGPGEYIIKAEADGYETTYNNWSIDKLYKYESSISLKKPFYINRAKKKKEYQLSEVVVKATKIKFYHKGDTVVYNADAFELAEGSMLDALIKQLPGVELKEGGEITVNGRRVDELLLNGRDFLNSDRKLMLGNLPSYMVKNIKVFEKDDIFAQKRGDKQAKLYSMDVQLKKEYSIGLIGNVEAGLGTDHRFLGRLFGLRFTPRSSLVFHGNANNLSDDRNPGNQGDWSPLKQPTGVTSVYSGGGIYQYQSDAIVYKGDVKVTHSDGKRRTYTNSENFISSGNTYGRSFGNSNSHNTSVVTNQRLTVIKDINLGAVKFESPTLLPFLEYNKYSNNSDMGSATANGDIFGSYGKAWRDSITAPNAGQLLRTYGLNRVVNNTEGNGHRFHTGAKWDSWGQIAHNDNLSFSINGNIDFSDSKTRLFEHYGLQYLQDNTTDFRNRYTLNDGVGFKNEVSVRTNNFHFANDHMDVMPEYTYTYKRQTQNRSLYLLNKLDGWGEQTEHELGELPSVDEMLLALDNGNSYRQREADNIHKIAMQIQASNRGNGNNDPKIAVDGNFWPSIRFERNKMDYQRGNLDTLFHRDISALEFAGHLRIYKNSWPKPWDIDLSYNVSTQAPDMTYLVDFRDDSNPLNIMLGNPHLKNTRTHNMGIKFERNMKKQRMFNTSIGSHIYEHRLAMGYTYDTQTGVRTVTPDNINGNWDITGQLNYSARFDKDGKFTYSTSTDATYINSVDLIEQLRSEVHTTNINETLKFNARFSAKASLNFKADLHWQHSTSGRENFSTINVADFDYGVGGVFQIPLGFQFSTDMTMYSRRGYSDHSMNTNELVWNARLSRHFAKAGITVMLDAFDLFGQLSNVRRTINAQGRTETWSNVTPQYAMLHVLYRLNKKPKNK